MWYVISLVVASFVVSYLIGKLFHLERKYVLILFASGLLGELFYSLFINAFNNNWSETIHETSITYVYSFILILAWVIFIRLLLSFMESDTGRSLENRVSYRLKKVSESMSRWMSVKV